MNLIIDPEVFLDSDIWIICPKCQGRGKIPDNNFSEDVSPIQYWEGYGECDVCKGTRVSKIGIKNE